MNKVINVLIIIILSGILFSMGFKKLEKPSPRTYYKVYLDNEELGTIKSKNELEKFIDSQGDYYKKKYGVNKIYSPNGLEIKKINTYDSKTISVEKIYKEIISKKPLTIKAHQITLTEKQIETEAELTQEKKQKKIIVTDPKIMEKSLEQIQEIFVGGDNYEKFIKNTQPEIETTGKIIEDIYINETKTIKEVNIPVSDVVFTDTDTLTEYLLFGEKKELKNYKVKVGDTISSISFDHEINPEEFLISNPNFTSITNLLYPGQEVNIGATNPQLQVITKEFVVKETENKYKVEIKYDKELPQGQEKIIQKGVNGLDKIKQTIISSNGTILEIENTSKEELKAPVTEILVKGDKQISWVGNTSVWSWPTAAGWSITEEYTYRINPITGGRELHGAIDISGTGRGSPIYAANNGTVTDSRYSYDYGHHVIINHNNGYMTLYSHMISSSVVKVGDIVERGQQIGSMGASGWATGVHLHFEVWYGGRFKRINPWSLYR